MQIEFRHFRGFFFKTEEDNMMVGILVILVIVSTKRNMSSEVAGQSPIQLFSHTHLLRFHSLVGNVSGPPAD